AQNPSFTSLAGGIWHLSAYDAKTRGINPVLLQGIMDASSQKLVLIVEDNDLNTKLFRDLLEAHGYRTAHTHDGMEVIPLTRQHKPDLIVMDIQLPEISGLDVIKWLKSDPALKSIPVIAVTAFAMKGDEEKIRAGGCEEYLSKPITVQEFINAVKRFLE